MVDRYGDDPWKELTEAAHSSKHATIEPKMLVGMKLFEAHKMIVSGDPRVRAFGRLVRARFPGLESVFFNGRFDGIRENSDFGWPAIARGTLWPVVFRLGELSSDLLRVLSRGACHDNRSQWEAEETLFSHAAEALEDRHNAFFEEFRNGRLILKGFLGGFETKRALPAEFVKRHDLYFDVIDGGIFLCETSPAGANFEPCCWSCVEGACRRKRSATFGKIAEAEAKVVAAQRCKRGITSTSQPAQHSLTELAAARGRNRSAGEHRPSV